MSSVSSASSKSHSDPTAILASYCSSSALRSYVAPFLWCLLCVVSGVMNTVTFVTMGRAMPDWPLFLLYGVTALYLIPAFAWLYIRQQSESVMYLGPPMRTWTHYFWIALISAVAGILLQYSDPYVSGTLQALITQMELPMTIFIVRVFVGYRFTYTEKLGALIVFVGSLLPVGNELYEASTRNSETEAALLESGLDADISAELNSVFWLSLFIISDLPVAIHNVWQEFIFSAFQVDEVHYLAWSHVLILGMYVAALPLSKYWAHTPHGKAGGVGIGTTGVGWPHSHTLDEVWANQAEAFNCVMGWRDAHTGLLPHNCGAHAGGAVLLYVASVTVNYFSLAVIIKKYSSTFLTLVNALVTPASAIVFASPLVPLDSREKLDLATVVGCGIIFAGILIYKWPFAAQCPLPGSGSGKEKERHAHADRDLVAVAGNHTPNGGTVGGVGGLSGSGGAGGNDVALTLLGGGGGGSAHPHTPTDATTLNGDTHASVHAHAHAPSLSDRDSVAVGIGTAGSTGHAHAHALDGGVGDSDPTYVALFLRDGDGWWGWKAYVRELFTPILKRGGSDQGKHV